MIRRWTSTAGEMLLALVLLPGCATYTASNQDAGRDADGFVADGDHGGAGDSDTGIPDSSGDNGLCVVKDPLPLDLMVNGDAHSWCTGTCTITGDAQVIYKGGPSDRWTSEVWLLFTATKQVVKLFSALPSGYEIPVKPGEILGANVKVDSPWWVNQSVALTGPDGMTRFVQNDMDYQPASTQARCPPRQVECGDEIFPALNYLDPSGRPVALEQGDQGLVRLDDGAVAKALVGRLITYLTMQCADVPGGWLQLALLNNSDASQCHCLAQSDCSGDEVCDTVAGRCTRNRCVTVDCTPGKICDPYVGGCVTPPAAACRGDADCKPLQICNTLTGICLDDLCQVVDCATACSGLIHRCYGCIADCDCHPGVCNRDTFSCEAGCDGAKLNFTQDNPQSYELVWVCVDPDLPSPGDLLTKVDSKVFCGGGIGGSHCASPSDSLCSEALEFTTGTHAIGQDQWMRLCALSRLPSVHQLVGGYYER